MTSAELKYTTHHHAVTPTAPADVLPDASSGFVFKKAVVLDATNRIRIMMQYTDANGNINNSVFKNWTFTVWGNGHRGDKLTSAWYSDKWYFIEVDNILATEFNVNYDFIMNDNEGNEYAISYSVQTYIRNTQVKTDANGNPTLMANCVSALWNYGHAASDYIDTFYNY